MTKDQTTKPLNDIGLNAFSRWFKRSTDEFWMAMADASICIASNNSAFLSISSHLKGNDLLLFLPQLLLTVTRRELITLLSSKGYAWSRVETPISRKANLERLSWKILNCNAVYHDVGIFWLLDRFNGLHCYYDGHLEEISLPTENQIVDLVVAPKYLWILTAVGEIYVRAGISHPVGTGWVELSTLQFSQKNWLLHVTLAANSSWAVDVIGQVYFRLGDNGPPTLLSPAWSLVDDSDVKFLRTYAGPCTFMVWAIDMQNNVYARGGVSSDFLIGTAWTKVSGINAAHLALR